MRQGWLLSPCRKIQALQEALSNGTRQFAKVAVGVNRPPLRDLRQLIIHRPAVRPLRALVVRSRALERHRAEVVTDPPYLPNVVVGEQDFGRHARELVAFLLDAARIGPR